MADPAASIIIPIYNAGRFLRDTLESCLAQTFADFEVIAVDDGSTDASREIVAEFAARDPRVRAFHSINMGQCVSRNIGLALARGRTIKFLDHDDLLPPWALADQLDALDSENADLAVGKMRRFQDAEERKVLDGLATDRGEIEPGERQIYRSLLQLDFDHAPTFNEILAKREILVAAGGFNPKLGTGEEANLLVRLHCLNPGIRVAFDPNPVILWKRLMDESLACALRRQQDFPWGLLSGEHSARFVLGKGIEITPEIRAHIFDRLYPAATYAFRNGNRGQALTAIEVWKRAGLPVPSLGVGYHDILHRMFGFGRAERLLDKVRVLRSVVTGKKDDCPST
ncbi:MAG: glycosyltransferase family 2 protein [Verrucomicrobiales bacterium]